VVDELLYLRGEYGVPRIDSVDNILDLRYITQVFPELKRRGADIEMFYEVKSNLKLAQLAALAEGGVRIVQPGIESFSDSVLALMRKGVTGFQNMQLLKWSEEVGILPAWNILAGFPGEDPAEYEWTADVLPLLTHFEPPTACAPIRLDRFSPLFTRAEASGLRRVRPTRAYYYVFPLGRRELNRLAYFFDFDYADGRKPASYVERASREVVLWREARFGKNPPRLDAVLQADGQVALEDSRGRARTPRTVLSDSDADTYLACDAVQNTRAIAARLEDRYTTGQVLQSLRTLADSGVLLSRGDHHLSLAVLRNRSAAALGPPAVTYASTAPDSDPLLRVLRPA